LSKFFKRVPLYNLPGILWISWWFGFGGVGLGEMIFYFNFCTNLSVLVYLLGIFSKQLLTFKMVSAKRAKDYFIVLCLMMWGLISFDSKLNVFYLINGL
jgi:hypothetical protein